MERLKNKTSGLRNGWGFAPTNHMMTLSYLRKNWNMKGHTGVKRNENP